MRLHRPHKGWFAAAVMVEAWAALAVTQVALRFWRFQQVRRVLQALARWGRADRPLESGVLLWAMKAAKRRCPIRTTCLGEALVAEALFVQHGYKPTLCIGAARREGRFEAHAWLEQDDTVVIGGPLEIVQQYSRFPEIASLNI